MRRDGIILTGMPGVGKSSVGVVLAKKLGMGFLDSDLVIQERSGRLLHELISQLGVDGFLELENEMNASIPVRNQVVATGGSAVFGREAMEHFKKQGVILYLSASYETIEERLGDLKERGVACRAGQTLKDLYEERLPLYRKYGEITIDCDGKEIREIVLKIEETLDHGV